MFILGSMAKRATSGSAASGGRARAEKLSPEVRSEIARQAAATRWLTAGKAVRRAVFEGDLVIADTKLPCAVLDDGTRVLARSHFIEAIGRRGKVKGGSKFERQEAKFKVPVFLAAENLKPFVSLELVQNSAPIHYYAKFGPNWGLRAEVLPGVCQVYLDAERAGVLQKNQQHIADHCRILSRGFATVGLFALIDEATGAQDSRAANALAEILEQFIAKELRKWVKTFPTEFFRGICRLRNVPFNDAFRFPSYFGHLINDVIYARLAPLVLAELRRKNPVTETGRRKGKLFQWLSEDVGDPKLRAHFIKVLTLFDASEDWETFYRLLDKALPRFSTQPLLAIAEEEIPPGSHMSLPAGMSPVVATPKRAIARKSPPPP